jgi:hypothetical protein
LRKPRGRAGASVEPGIEPAQQLASIGYAPPVRRPWWTYSRALSSVLGLVGAIVGWASASVPAVAVAGLVIVYVLMALVAGPLGRALGFPPYRPDEAYTVTLDRWRNERKVVELAKLGRKDG